MTTLPPRSTSGPQVAVNRSLLDEPETPSKAAITHTVHDDDVRAAVWLSHAWTRRLGGGALALLVTLAGLWGNAVLNSFDGMRTDVQQYMEKMDVRMAKADDERRALTISDATTRESLRTLSERMTAIETKCDAALTARWERSLSNYEQRHGIETPTGTR